MKIAKAKVLGADLARPSKGWLRRAAALMRDAVVEDWDAWRLGR